MASIQVKSYATDKMLNCTRFACECVRFTDSSDPSCNGVFYMIRGFYCGYMFFEFNDVVFCSRDVDVAMDELDRLNTLLAEAKKAEESRDITALFQEVGCE